jgi:DNA-binding LacI/PurR family transcriptional regulator
MLTGSAPVSAEVQRRIRQVAEKVGIELHQGEGSCTLAFILSNRHVLHPFHMRVLMSAESYCAMEGCDILFTVFNYSPRVPWNELHLPKVMLRRDVARALILAGNNSENLLCGLRQRGIPFAVLGNNVIGDWQRGNYNSVSSDSAQGANDITRYLISLGHQHIWYVGNCKLPWFATCYRGYNQAMQVAGLATKLSEIDSGDDKEIGYLGTKAILASQEPVTAIFAGTDHAAQGVYKAAFDCGLRIPEDLSVVGCDDTLGNIMHPPLTSICEFPEQFGKRLAQMVLERIRHPEAPPQQSVIPTAIAKRESCLPPRFSAENGAPKGISGEVQLASVHAGAQS